MQNTDACELQHRVSYHNCDMLHSTIVKVAKCHNCSALIVTKLISLVDGNYVITTMACLTTRTARAVLSEYCCG